MRTLKNEVKEAKKEAGKQKVNLVISEIESGIEIPPNERESKYDFGLSGLAEKQSRFVAVSAELPIEKLEAALRNHINREREHRGFKQNFVMRHMEKDGVSGIRVFCVSILDKPMRVVKNKAA